MLEFWQYTCMVFRTLGVVWEFSKSDDGTLVFACVATLRAIFHYGRGRRRWPETKLLAATAAVAVLMAGVIVISGSSLPQGIGRAAVCPLRDTRHIAVHGSARRTQD